MVTINNETYKIESENRDIATNFVNEYYINVGSSLAQNTLNSLNKTESQLQRLEYEASPTDPTHAMYKFDPISTNEVETIVRNLKDKITVGTDLVSTRIIKECIDSLKTPIQYVTNISLAEGIFPGHLKKAVVCPIYKGGKKDDIGCYRPISLLNSLSKIIETAAKRRLLDFIEKNNRLSDKQFGFRKNRGTQEAMAFLTQKVVNILDKGEKCITVFLDLAKAFDTVSHGLLLAKLYKMGVRGSAYKWFSNYLTDRTQKTKIGRYFSEEARIRFGVPQGSVLGPILFLVYINDLTEISMVNGDVVSFADDTALIFHARSWDEVYGRAEEGLRLVKNWLDTNLLTLNVAKTNYMTINITNRGDDYVRDKTIGIHNCDPEITVITPCNCPIIKKVKSSKYLGVLINERLDWKDHIAATADRLRGTVHVFKEIRNMLPLKTLKTIYFALVHSIISYGIVGWGGATLTALDPLIKVQKSILRVINKKPFRFPSEILFTEFGVLDIRQTYTKTIILHYIKHKHLQTGITHLLTTRCRNKQYFKVPKTRTRFAQRHFTFLAPRLLNKIQDNVLTKRQMTYTPLTKKLLSDWLLRIGRHETETILNYIPT
jgi:hypothetical protein